MALPMPINVPNVPPVCIMTLPKLVISSLPRRPYLIPAAVPKMAPIDRPTAPPIMAPYFILSKQETPPPWPLPATGISSREWVIDLVSKQESWLLQLVVPCGGKWALIRMTNPRGCDIEIRMQVSTANSVKVYNLSAGKSLPEWISERKRRTLLKTDIGELTPPGPSLHISLFYYRSSSPYWAHPGLHNASGLHKSENQPRQPVYTNHRWLVR